MSLVRIDIPSSVIEFNRVFFTFVAFDIFETFWIWNGLIDMQESPSYNEDFELIGYEDSYFLTNVGSSMAIALAQFAIFLLIMLIAKTPD